MKIIDRINSQDSLEANTFKFSTKFYCFFRLIGFSFFFLILELQEDFHNTDKNFLHVRD